MSLLIRAPRARLRLTIPRKKARIISILHLIPDKMDLLSGVELRGEVGKVQRGEDLWAFSA